MWTSSKPRALAALLASVLACTSLSAFAKEPTAGDLETARGLFNEGNDLRDKGDLKGALERFLAADELAHTTVTGLEVGKTYLALGKLAKAYAAFVGVGNLPETPKDSANVKSARADAALLAKEVYPRVPAITFRLGDDDVSVPSATFEIDGKLRDDARLGQPILLDPGVHVAIVHVEKRPERRVTIDAREGEKQVVVLTYELPKPLIKKTEPAPPAVATDTMLGTKILVYGGFGVAAAGVVAGTITGIITLSRAPSLRASCPGGRCPPSVHEERAEVTRIGNISNLSFIVAGCGALAGTIGFLQAPKSSESVPTPGPSPGAFKVSPVLGLGFIGMEGIF
jgi:hypothetical protein